MRAPSVLALAVAVAVAALAPAIARGQPPPPAAAPSAPPPPAPPTGPSPPPDPRAPPAPSIDPAPQGGAADPAGSGVAAGGVMLVEPLVPLVAAPPPPVFRPFYFPVNLSFLFPLSANAAHPDLWTNLDLAVLLGRVGFVDGLQLGSFGYIAHGLRGIQLTAASIVGERAVGAQIGGAFAYADGPLEGLQLAGLVGWSTGTVDGIQISGLGNQSYGAIQGIELGGIGNLARGGVVGLQGGGLFNVGTVEGVQLGGINVAEQVRGLQIGVINVARRIDGLQIGVINVTDNLDGESIGVAPIPRRGGVHVLLWGSNTLYGNAGIKFASRYAYSILSASIHNVPRDADPTRPPQVIYAGGLTFGARVPLPSGFSLAADFGAYRVFRDRFTFAGHDEILKTRVLLAFEVAHRLTPFVGAGIAAPLRSAPFGASLGPELCAGVEL